VGTRDYYARLRQSLNDAEAVLALNPVNAAMLEPYSSRVRIVPWGMDAARFPWPVAEGPQAGETGGAAPGANGAGAEGRPAVGPAGGVERPAPSAEGRPAVGPAGGVERPAPSAEGRPTVGPEGGVERHRLYGDQADFRAAYGRHDDPILRNADLRPPLPRALDMLIRTIVPVTA
jgi:hypothetical protein